MNPEQLLIPRYVVIADYPGNPHPIGRIIEKRKHLDGKYYVPGMLHDPDDYPAIYKKLGWFEQRRKQDLTGYIKIFLNYEWIVYQIDITDKDIMKWQFGARRPSEFEPATEKEFNEQIEKSHAKNKKK